MKSCGGQSKSQCSPAPSLTRLTETVSLSGEAHPAEAFHTDSDISAGLSLKGYNDLTVKKIAVPRGGLGFPSNTRFAFTTFNGRCLIAAPQERTAI